MNSETAEKLIEWIEVLIENHISAHVDPDDVGVILNRDDIRDQMIHYLTDGC